MSLKLFHNGVIRTMDPAKPVVEAVLVEAERIKATGRYADLVQALDKGGESCDLDGAALLPGFNDAHVHVWKIGHLLTTMLDLRGVKSIRELQEKLEVFSRDHDGEWIVGRGFNEIQLEEGRMPLRNDLDAVLADRPVFLIRTCAHIGVANSRALELAGIDHRSRNPAGGRIAMDSAGYPTGVVAETAMGLVQRLVPAPSPADYRRMILAAGRSLLSAGITSATDPAVMPDLLRVYRDMDADASLPLRLNAMAVLLPDGRTETLPLPEKYHSDRLRIDSVKFFADGGLSGQTAALKRPYRNGSNRGLLRLHETTFLTLAGEAHRNGYRIGTHAIGDEAITLVLSVYERLQRECGAGTRHRIEHLGLPYEEHLRRMAALQAIAVPQAIFLRELGANFRGYLDDDYLQHCYPLRSILDHGITMALSSDAPVVQNFRPLAGVQAALLRQDESGKAIAPEEGIPVANSLNAYTQGAAEAAGEEANQGSISSGKWADMVVLERDPVAEPPQTLEHISVKKVFLAGQLAFENEEN